MVHVNQLLVRGWLVGHVAELHHQLKRPIRVAASNDEPLPRYVRFHHLCNLEIASAMREHDEKPNGFQFDQAV